MTVVSRPLEGLRVIEMGVSVAGPFGGMILAELGAEVIKIENPVNGDDARLWGPPFLDKSSALFQALNRNKKSAAVDLKDADQLDELKDYIVGHVDIVLQNMRPGLVAKFGLDGETLRKEKPSLIYANLGAFGRQGPLADRPGYDPLMQAFAGIMSITGIEGQEPVRVGPSLVDGGTGMWGVIGILSALHRRKQTGEGCVIDTSLMETAVSWVGVHVANYLASGKVPGKLGTENFSLAPYKAYRCADGWLIIAAGNDSLFRRAANALGHPEWVDDPRFKTNPDRVTNREALNALVDEATVKQPRDHWMKALEKAGVPNAPIQSIDELVAHPQLIASGMLQAPPEGSETPLIGLPVSFDGERPPYRSIAPELGTDTKQIRDTSDT